MKTWFYAVMVETAGWYNAAVKARSANEARALLAKRYPHACVHSLER